MPTHHAFVRKMRKAVATWKARHRTTTHTLDKRLRNVMHENFRDVQRALEQHRKGEEHPIQTYGRIAHAKRNAALRRAFVAARVFAYETRKQLVDGNGNLVARSTIEEKLGKRRADILYGVYAHTMRIGGELEGVRHVRVMEEEDLARGPKMPVEEKKRGKAA